MRSQQIPIADFFVIPGYPNDKAIIAKALNSLATVERIAHYDLLLLTMHKPSTDPRTVWHELIDQLMNRIGPQYLPIPIIQDELGVLHYPTGEITLRFQRSLSDQEVQNFCNEHGFCFRRRNEFVPEQIVCQAGQLGPSYLPDLIEQASSLPLVATIWLNTISTFERIV